ncbi:MAG: DUF58 domain-containing protein [Pseudomonadota bacterium]
MAETTPSVPTQAQAQPTEAGRPPQESGRIDIRRPGQWNSYRLEAESLTEAAPPLLVEADQVAAAIAQGVHGRRQVGTGETFWQYRRFRPGDLYTQIDWRRSGRSRHHFIRENEWEAAQSIWFWRDGSASMGYRSADTIASKRARATILTLALCSLLVRGGERIAALGDGHPPSNGRVALRRLAYGFGDGTLGEEPVLPTQELPPFSHLVVMGDFLWSEEDVKTWTEALDWYGNRRVKVHIVQVLDPFEIDFPFRGRTEFRDLEQRLTLLVGRSESLAEAYRNKLAAIADRLAHLANRYGWNFIRHRTDQPAQSALLALYAALSDQLKTAPGGAP